VSNYEKSKLPERPRKYTKSQTSTSSSIYWTVTGPQRPVFAPLTIIRGTFIPNLSLNILGMTIVQLHGKLGIKLNEEFNSILEEAAINRPQKTYLYVKRFYKNISLIIQKKAIQQSLIT
jgi:hypothetical protein